jgi:nucleoside-diphosphate-sugar epimerase
MKKILLIGGGGYVGSVITQSLLDFGHSVRCLDNFIYKNQQTVLPFLQNQNYEFVFGDLCKISILEKARTDVTDVVILAGLVGDPITKKYPKESNLINDLGVIGILDYFSNKKLDKLLFISTCSNYGLIKGNELADENFELSPLSLYATSKVNAEKHLLSLKEKANFSGTILRFATAFGLSPRMRFDLTVSEFTRDLALKKELLVYDAHTWRPYCHVKDFARLINNVILAPKYKTHFEVFNAGGEINNFTKQGIIDLVLKYLPNSKVTYKEHGSDPRNYRVSFQKVKNILGFEPFYTVEDGIVELINAIDMNIFQNIDDNKNFYGNYEISYK